MLLYLILLLSVLAGLGLCAVTGAFGSLLWLLVLPVGFVLCFALCFLVCFLAVWIPSRSIDPEKVEDRDDPYVRTIVKLYAPAVFKLLGCRIHTRGKELLPRDGRFMLVCNHIHELDPGIPLTIFPNAQLAFISKKENLDLPIIGKMMLKIQCQLLDRENDRAAQKTAYECISILKEDRASIGVFPEGGILGGGYKLHHFRPGVFKIAQKANVPIVVCTLRGTDEVVKNLRKFRHTDVDFRLLEVIPAGELQGVTTTQIAERVHAIMAADIGPELTEP